ncbi:MmpS family protein [Mycobacterium deserti]|uniref:MmpS family protein n=1 Tax=Mycobacterium deserti TaxID=2978347 RepID=A0ABT2ME23_9MYCO|nr:MmpS family protein [Mycobacterium deserti]MCT7660529.1 MmpS family protein [Mycobacterium deserti]
MTDRPRREEQSGWSGREEQSGPYGDGYSGYTDPAYAGQAPYGPTYQPPAGPAPTERLSDTSPYGYDPYAAGQYGAPYAPGEPQDEEPKSPRWLWVLAAVSVVAVIGLVIALVIVNSGRQETVVAPLPSMPEPDMSTSTPATTSRTPLPPVVPVPTAPSRPSSPPTTGTTAPGATQTVVYDVSGDGRAINITYVDAGGVLQTEFNVMLPWSKAVQLSAPADASASVSIINVGREVNCSISIDGAVVQQRSGAGLTVCTAIG